MSDKAAAIFRAYDLDKRNQLDHDALMAALMELGALNGLTKKKLNEILAFGSESIANRHRTYTLVEFMSFAERISQFQSKQARSERASAALNPTYLHKFKPAGGRRFSYPHYIKALAAAQAESGVDVFARLRQLAVQPRVVALKGHNTPAGAAPFQRGSGNMESRRQRLGASIELPKADEDREQHSLGSQSFGDKAKGDREQETLGSQVFADKASQLKETKAHAPAGANDMDAIVKRLAASQSKEAKAHAPAGADDIDAIVKRLAVCEQGNKLMSTRLTEANKKLKALQDESQASGAKDVRGSKEASDAAANAEMEQKQEESRMKADAALKAMQAKSDAALRAMQAEIDAPKGRSAAAPATAPPHAVAHPTLAPFPAEIDAQKTRSAAAPATAHSTTAAAPSAALDALIKRWD
eukprot:gene8133-1381_t